MELLLFICALVAISLLAAVFGHDSRDDVIASKEHALALMGLTWDGAPRPTLATDARASGADQGKLCSAVLENAGPLPGWTVTHTLACPPRRGARTQSLAGTTTE